MKRTSTFCLGRYLPGYLTMYSQNHHKERFRRMLRLSFIIVNFPAYISTQALSCNFDSSMKNSTILPCVCDGSDCFMNQVTGTDDLDWRAWQGETPSVNTGPTDDHTLGNGIGMYIYFEATGLKPGDQAVVGSNLLSLGETSCLTLWYHMYGLHMGTLHVQATFSNGGEALLWEKSGQQGNMWLEVKVPLHSTVTEVSFGATKGGSNDNQPFSDFALDDIMIKRQPCSGSTNPTTPEGSHSSSLTTSTTRTSTTSTMTSTSSSTSQTTPSLGTTTTKSSPNSSSMMSSTSSTTHMSTSSNTGTGIPENNGLSSNLTTVIIVLVALLVVAGTVIGVVVLVLRHRRQIVMVKKYDTTPRQQPGSDNQESEYEDVNDMSVATHSTNTEAHLKYEHITMKHNEYSNERINGPYEVIT